MSERSRPFSAQDTSVQVQARPTHCFEYFGSKDAFAGRPVQISLLPIGARKGTLCLEFSFGRQ